MQVYVHEDNSVSYPFCDMGERCCNTMGCTCSNDYPILRTATLYETEKFWEDLKFFADEALAESMYDR